MEILQERKKTHGRWKDNSDCFAQLYDTVSDSVNLSSLTNSQFTALTMILMKVSRILSGNPNERDHWDDIIGYAALGRDGDHPDDTN